MQKSLKTVTRACAAFVLLVAAVLSPAAARQPGDLEPLRGYHQVEARVTGISDGDTAWLALPSGGVRVRLAQIDAPESGQAFGKKSEQALRELIGKRVVVATWREVDRYGRPIVQLTVDGVDVNASMVRQGMAWAYRAHLKDKRLLELEAAAKAAKLGLWSDPHPQAPWDWRKARRGGSLDSL